MAFDDLSSNFENIAKEYKFKSGDDKIMDIEEICLHNAKVA